VILLLPAIAYLATTWRNRREFLLDRLGPDAVRLYYKQFFPSSAQHRTADPSEANRAAAAKRAAVLAAQAEHAAEVKDAAEAEAAAESKLASENESARAADRTAQADRAAEAQSAAEDIKDIAQFRKDFGRLYGRRHYVLPLLLLALVSAIGLLATSRSIQAWLGWIPADKSFPRIAVSAFLGGYAWVLYDQFRRFRTGDFTAHDVYAGIYRFLIAIPMGVSLASLLKDNAGIGVAFLLAAFPTTTLFTIARRLANQKLGLGETQEGGSLELEKLQCVGRTNAERYVDEGITTIAELAWADPIDLTIKTNREFNFVIDSVSQALLWVYFEDRVKQLYPLSLRGAQEVCTLFDSLVSEEPKERNAAEKNLAAAAAIMELDVESCKYTLIGVKDDPYAQFLFNVWS
jgi:hypothetical protein